MSADAPMWVVEASLMTYPVGTSGHRRCLFYRYLDAADWVQDLLDDDELEIGSITIGREGDDDLEARIDPQSRD